MNASYAMLELEVVLFAHFDPKYKGDGKEGGDVDDKVHVVDCFQEIVTKDP